jgi:hypothetical protein
LFSRLNEHGVYKSSKLVIFSLSVYEIAAVWKEDVVLKKLA